MIKIHALGHIAVDNGGAVGGVAGGVIVLDLHLTGQCFVQGVNEPLRCSVQSLVLNQLADTDLVYGSVRRGVGVSRGARWRCRREHRSWNRRRRPRDSIMAAARASASIFFFIIIFSFESVSGTMNRMRDGKKKRGLVRGTEPPHIQQASTLCLTGRLFFSALRKKPAKERA